MQDDLDVVSRISLQPDFSGQVAWVTGASRGLGRAVAVALAGAGASLVISARSAPGLAATEEICARYGADVIAVCGSVVDEQHGANAVGLAFETWGRLDILVNNAGVSPSLTPTERLSSEEWRQIIDVNLTGAFLCSQAAARPMLAAGQGCIVNISSVHGRSGREKLAGYAASKGGLELLTRSLAVEWAERGVRVNAVAPGYLETEMTLGLRSREKLRTDVLNRTPLGRFGVVDDVTPTILFLASDNAAYVTGSVWPIDGGWTAC